MIGSAWTSSVEICGKKSIWTSSGEIRSQTLTRERILYRYRGNSGNFQKICEIFSLFS